MSRSFRMRHHVTLDNGAEEYSWCLGYQCWVLNRRTPASYSMLELHISQRRVPKRAIEQLWISQWLYRSINGLSIDQSCKNMLSLIPLRNGDVINTHCLNFRMKTKILSRMGVWGCFGVKKKNTTDMRTVNTDQRNQNAMILFRK